MAEGERDHYAARAVVAYRAMLSRFRKRDGMYRYDEGPPIRTAAQLWPFARALVATLDVAGMGPELAGGLDTDGLIDEHVAVLERYWDPAGPRPAYCSDVAGASRRGDRYYDDNAWVGLALIELERLRPGSNSLSRAEELFLFAVHGWDEAGGGVFWVEQGRGTGIRNHDRNTVSNAPNAELGLHLADLGRPQRGPVGAEDMYQWVLDTLDESRDGDGPGTGLFRDKVRADGTIDRATWSYNQGSMIGAAVLLARTQPEGRGNYVGQAEAMARKALRRLADAYPTQPPAFHAIFFRNLLLLHDATESEELRSQITGTIRDYAEAIWPQAQAGRSLLGLRRGPRLLQQSAFVQVLALLAWDPAAYGRIA